MHSFVHTTNIAQKAGPFSVARLKMDLPFHSRLAFTGEMPALFRFHEPGRTKEMMEP